MGVHFMNLEKEKAFVTQNRAVAMVTGGASGIGRSTVLRLASQGYDVVINYSSSASKAQETAREAEKLGVGTLVLQGDVSDDQRVRSMLDEVRERFGRLDALVNNAGTTALTPT